MTTPRFFVSPLSIEWEASNCDFVTIEDQEQIRQMQKVLRLNAGDRVDVLDGTGAQYLCMVEKMTMPLSKRSKNEREERPGKAALLKILERKDASGELPCKIFVLMPMIKQERFEWALQKMTELGVFAIIPFISERTVVRPEKMVAFSDLIGSDKDEQVELEPYFEAKGRRWCSILKEAAEQSERAIIPRLFPPAAISSLDALSNAEKKLPDLGGIEFDIGILCAERSGAPSICDLLYAQKSPGLLPLHILLVLGPEGGLTNAEREKFFAAGFKSVSLGARILRSETAAVCALSQIGLFYA